jgi:hypothetical protein
MNKHMFYRVSWSAGGRAEESRELDEWEPAAEFYQGLVADRRTDAANLVEVTETEVRCFEREAAARRQPARGVPAGDRALFPPDLPTGRGRTWLTDTEDSP